MNFMLPDLMVMFGLGTESRCSYLGIESRSIEEYRECEMLLSVS